MSFILKIPLASSGRLNPIRVMAFGGCANSCYAILLGTESVKLHLAYKCLFLYCVRTGLLFL